MDNQSSTSGSSPSIDKETLDRIRHAKNREVLSEFIRIGQSDLYDYEPVRRAVLKEIAFLQVHDEATKIPKDSPYRGQYEGWCYASERFLACRVGTTEGYVKNCVKLMEDDGVITTRLWHDKLGYPHQEYHVLEEVVTAQQRPEGFIEYERKTPRRGGNKQANKGSFKTGNKVRAIAHDSRLGTDTAETAEATALHSRSHRTPQPSATAHDSRKPPHSTAVTTAHDRRSETAVESLKGVGLGGKGLEGSFLAGTNTASGLASVAADAAKLANGVVLASKLNQIKTPTGMEKRVQKPNGMEGKPMAKLPNRLCYPEAFKHCYDKDGRWIVGAKVPPCRKCGGLLHPNENHECEGYEPKYPTMDMEAREYAREALLDAKEADLDERLAHWDDD